jgi:hypothetical protein
MFCHLQSRGWRRFGKTVAVFLVDGFPDFLIRSSGFFHLNGFFGNLQTNPASGGMGIPCDLVVGLLVDKAIQIIAMPHTLSAPAKAWDFGQQFTVFGDFLISLRHLRGIILQKRGQFMECGGLPDISHYMRGFTGTGLLMRIRLATGCKRQAKQKQQDGKKRMVFCMIIRPPFSLSS